MTTAGTQQLIQWVREVVRRFGTHATAERLGVSVRDIERLDEPNTEPSIRLTQSAAALRERRPSLHISPKPTPPIDPRNKKTIPLIPYEDEREFFGEDMTYIASRWRQALRSVERTRGGDDPMRANAAREDLLKLEISLMKDHGMTLATEQRHSQAADSPTLRRRERWEWRERDLADLVAARMEAEGIVNRDNIIRRIFQPTTQPP